MFDLARLKSSPKRLEYHPAVLTGLQLVQALAASRTVSQQATVLMEDMRTASDLRGEKGLRLFHAAGDLMARAIAPAVPDDLSLEGASLTPDLLTFYYAALWLYPDVNCTQTHLLPETVIDHLMSSPSDRARRIGKTLLESPMRPAAVGLLEQIDWSRFGDQEPTMSRMSFVGHAAMAGLKKAREALALLPHTMGLTWLTEDDGPDLVLYQALSEFNPRLAESLNQFLRVGGK